MEKKHLFSFREMDRRYDCPEAKMHCDLAGETVAAEKLLG